MPTLHECDGVLRSSISLLQVDCTANSNTCNKYGVSGYPTLKVFRDGEEAGAYDGPRTAGKDPGMVLQHFPIWIVFDLLLWRWECPGCMAVLGSTYLSACWWEGWG